MKVKYQIETVFTYKNFENLYKAIARKKNHFWLKHGILEGIILLGAVLSYFVWHYQDITEMFVLSAVVYPFFVHVVTKSNIRRQWKTMRRKWGQKSVLHFHDEYFVQNVDERSNRFGYHELKDIMETGTHFHLMIGNTNGISIEKSNCPAGLENFLREVKPRKE